MRAALILLLGLSSCGKPAPLPQPEAPVIEQGEIETMADGRCFAFSAPLMEPQIIVERVVSAPETTDENGNVLTAAVYRDEEREILVPVGEPERFEVICPQNLSQSFVATVQRALLARGYYVGSVNGLMDQQTRNAILSYQKDQGLRSPNLGVETAIGLGLVSAEQ